MTSPGSPDLSRIDAWAMHADAVLAELDGGEHGLGRAEAEERLRRHGPNELPEEEGPGAATIALRQFRSPLIYILLLAGLVTIAVGEHLDAAVIGAVLALNAVVGFVQEHGAERSMAALRRLASARARVLRDGREREADVRELVPGDVVLLGAGSRVPADCRLLHEAGLEVDESHLTGESETVAKGAAPLAPETPLPERANMLFMGSAVTLGRARAVVVATGAPTELGRIAGSLREIGEVQTPLQRRISRLARVIGLAVLAFGLAGFGLGTLRGDDLGELLFAVVALAVSAVPEGLPTVLTVALAISVRRMAARRAIVRRLPAVETLGSCTAIASDKTGTLTENRMTVQAVLAGGERFEVTGSGYGAGGEIRRDGRPVEPAEGSPLRLTLLAGALCNDASAVPGDGEYEVSGDPTEIGLLVAAAKAGMYRDELEEELPRWGEIPFDPSRRFAATFHRRDGGGAVFVKGAPERVLEMCADAAGEAGLDRERALEEAHGMAARGLRVIGLAMGELSEPEAESLHDHLDGLTFLGLEGMIDPPREEARDAVRGCREAGIRVLMVTGDHAVTARAIAAELGVAAPEARVVSGAELDELDDEGLREGAAPRVLARHAVLRHLAAFYGGGRRATGLT